MKRFAFILCIFVLASCSATIAPKQIHQKQPSFTSTGQDSGILKDTAKQTVGFIVTQEWLAGYDALLARYGDKLTPPRKTGDREGITKEGDHYRINDAVMERQQWMNARRINEGP